MDGFKREHVPVQRTYVPPPIIPKPAEPAADAEKTRRWRKLRWSNRINSVGNWVFLIIGAPLVTLGVLLIYRPLLLMALLRALSRATQ